MTLEAVQTKISMEDYLEMEATALERHEYVDGKIRPMAYAAENHRHICSNLNRLLGNFYVEREESVFTNQTLIFIQGWERGYYPDATIFPPDIQYRDYRGKMKAALNPLVIIEVLSDSTASVDRGEKWLTYKTIPSLRQYVLVSQDEMRVEIYNRHNGGSDWLYQSFEEDDAEVPIGDSRILMKELYRKAVFAQRHSDEIQE